MQPEPPDQLDVVSQSRWYVLAETELGYGIWRVGQPRTEPPLRTFGEDADAFSDADREFRRRNRWMRTHVTLPKFLAGVVFVAILIWIVASAIVNGSYIFAALGDPGGFFQRHLPPVWLRFVESLANNLWVGALVVLLTLFLLRRSSEGPDRG